MDHFKSEQLTTTCIEVPMMGPYWDGKVLYFNGRRLAVFKGAARVIGVVLNAFQEEGWPPFVYDPLDGGGDRRVRLHNLVTNLNKKLGKSVMSFFVDRTGTRICWRPI